MSSWDSPDLLLQFNQLAGRPGSDAVTDTTKYGRLARAQDRVIARLAGIAPYALYPKVDTPSLPTMETDDGNVFTFGFTLTRDPIVPIGATQIYPSLTAIPESPWRLGVDYLNEVTQIRLLNNRTYSGTLYWRGIPNTAALTADVDPILQPLPSRELIVVDAVRQFAKEFVRSEPLRAEMQDEWDRLWPVHCLVWKTQFTQGGALSSITGRQLALTTQ